MLKVDKRIKDMPWPEKYRHDGNQNFKVTLSWPVVDHERFLVATFVKNRANHTNSHGADFRLVCSKKQNRVAVLYKGGRCKRDHLDTPLNGFGTGCGYCYPEISSADEKALLKWLGERQTGNHGMPELYDWTYQAVQDEIQAEKEKRGEIMDEDVMLCPDGIPDGLERYIRNVMLPEDKVLIYKKGNTRGLCYQCGQHVRAGSGPRFRQNETVRCPNCGEKVTGYLETGESYKAEYVNNVATIQKGKDGKTVFVRLWHLLRDPTAKWDDIQQYLREVARYAVRGDKIARFQHEAKENYYTKAYRYGLSTWTRMGRSCEVYDGSYFFYLPPEWRDILSGTSLQFCELKDFISKGKNNCANNPIRLLLDWSRYPAIEKFWKTGYTTLVKARISHPSKNIQTVIKWRKNRLQDALGFPIRLLKFKPAEKWDEYDIKRVGTLWQEAVNGRITEADLQTLFLSKTDLSDLNGMFGRAQGRKIIAYLEKIVAAGLSSRDWRDYVRECETLGYDLNDKTVLFPDDLAAAHRRTTETIQERQDAKRREELAKKSEKFAAQVKKLKKLAWEDGELLIRPAENAEELQAEGKRLKHCVYSYASDMDDGKTAIFFIRRKDDPAEPFYTLEWKGNSIVQCRTHCNKSYTDDPQVWAFANAWKNRVLEGSKQKVAIVA